MKGKPRSVQKRKLHETPAEFAKAAEYKVSYERWHPESLSVKREREERRERIRNMKMPAHEPPDPKCVCWAMGKPYAYESDKSYERRLARWYKRWDKKGKTHSKPKKEESNQDKIFRKLANELRKKISEYCS